MEDFIDGHCWRIPSFMKDNFPHLVEEIETLPLASPEMEDSRIWRPSNSGVLYFKDAFLFLQPPFPRQIHSFIREWFMPNSLRMKIWYEEDVL